MSPVIGFRRGTLGHPEELPEFTHGWLEAPLRSKLVRLESVADPEWRNLDAWPAGRVFGSEGEYRWQRLADGILHSVLLLETSLLPDGFGAPLVLQKGDDAAFVLWGKWIDPEGDPKGNQGGGPRFYAQEIPEIQDYPLDLEKRPEPGATPRLLACRYRDAAGRQGEFIRCVGVSLTAPGERDHG
jgi:hypothetical protein